MHRCASGSLFAQAQAWSRIGSVECGERGTAMGRVAGLARTEGNDVVGFSVLAT
jgi:hypothetical protein